MNIKFNDDMEAAKVNKIVNKLNKDLVYYLEKYEASPEVLFNVIPSFATNSFELLINALEIENMELSNEEIRLRIVSYLEKITMKLLVSSEKIISDVIGRKAS